VSCSRGCCPTQLDHYRSVSIAASACPSREGGRYAAEVNAREKRWERDFAAMDALKPEGIVPKTSEGLADLVTQATTRTEIERGKVMTKGQKDAYKKVYGSEIP
jgi:hypothetical protein